MKSRGGAKKIFEVFHRMLINRDKNFFFQIFAFCEINQRKIPQKSKNPPPLFRSFIASIVSKITEWMKLEAT
jgi:hypothetical protein